MNTIPSYYDVANGDLQTAVFVNRGLERALRYHASDGWSTDRQGLEEFVRLMEGEVVFDGHKVDGEVVVLDLPHSVLMVDLNRGSETTPHLSVQIYAGSRQAVRLEMARVKELIPLADSPASDEISVAFWYRGNRGARKVMRRLNAPTWSESKRNYPLATRAALEPSMAGLARVIVGGRLILWHGPPGTGKTSALRTLALENRDGLLLEYVIDPETFFGYDAGYFVSVLFNDDVYGEDDKLRLLVLEDCDELLVTDARRQGGQGLARLLNVVDGLIGQGLQIGVLITTNEPLSGLHPAVSRPGRCGAVVPFELFSGEEAAGWLGGDGGVRGATSLADLFAIEGGRETAAPTRPRIGFETRR
jgi:hypothetical protein